MDFIRKVIEAISDSEENGRDKTLPGVTGLSGDKLIGLLQRCTKNISSNYDGVYLEIGVYQGLTLSSVAASSPGVKCFGIDNFSQYDPEGVNREIVENRLKNNTAGNGFLINEDFEKALLSLPQYIGENKVAVYFVDGPHDYRSQYLCLDFVRDNLADNAVILIDDANYEHVRRASSDWLKSNNNYSLLYEAYTSSHPSNMSVDEKLIAQKGWWNGVNVIVSDSEGLLEKNYPPVDSGCEKYLNDHLIHAEKFSELAPVLLQAIRLSFPRMLVKFCYILFKRNIFRGGFDNLNTNSKNLPPLRMAKYNKDS